jgi:hypothetical protein
MAHITLFWAVDRSTGRRSLFRAIDPYFRPSILIFRVYRYFGPLRLRLRVGLCAIIGELEKSPLLLPRLPLGHKAVS